ncbi:PTS transporter subunit IIC [Tepidibacter hydrothermalis]|uniref:PTS sugar transporter subunit IIC n=1 Tax=Tepidibacter hydrothermalis TaxID=3036126 RepID=A0ABY8EBJ9_9FIRM|nr:PTS sugar transporter subunit IIC [Tepidibacter hydrothermalis]WFD10310.1 PTS sugar transporter subunit IIC [Tepidibacter hydrothermalis]
MREYLTKTLNGMALGLFSSLIIGLILKQIGDLSGFENVVLFGKIAQYMMGPAIGAGVAYSLGAPPLVIFASLITGAIGAGTVNIVDGVATLRIGDPVGAFVASLIAAEIGRLLSGKTSIDIVLIPAIVILVGGFVGIFIAPILSSMMSSLGNFINKATELKPIPMGIIVAVTMGIILTLPISSAALSIALGLNGLAAGAALVGCCCQMIGFAVASYRENKIGGLISQGLGTSMLQVPNLIKNPLIWIPPIIASAILGPLSTTLFHMKTNSIGAGMGTSGLVGQISTIAVMGESAMLSIIILHFALPAVITLIISEFMRNKGYIKDGDMKLRN